MIKHVVMKKMEMKFRSELGKIVLLEFLRFKMKSLTSIASFLIVNLFFSITCVSQPGLLDQSFDPGSTFNDFVYDCLEQPDGKIVVVGKFFSASSRFVTRLNSDGSVDNTFNPPTFYNSTAAAFCCELQSDGKILIGGSFYTNNANGTQIWSLVRLNSDGTLDNTFNEVYNQQMPAWSGPGGTVTSMKLQPDGKIIVSGNWLYYNDIERRGTVRLNPDGSIDYTFQDWTYNGLQLVQGPFLDIAIQNDGKIIGVGENGIVRMNSNGTIDASFNSGNYLVNLGVNPDVDAPILSLILLNSGKILIGGNFTTYQGQSAPYLARLHSDGSFDNSFNSQGLGLDGGVHSMSLQSDNKIIIAGNFGSYNGIASEHIARIDDFGEIDNSFVSTSGAWGIGPVSTVYTTDIQNDGDILIGGAFDNYGLTPRLKLARINGGDYEYPTIQFTDISEPSCYGSCDGELTVTAAGGYPPFTYMWNNDVNLNSPELDDLCLGNYSVQVTDEFGFTTENSMYLEGAALLNVIYTPSQDGLMCSFISEITGGTPGYSYNWDFGDGSVSSIENPFHNYSDNGNYSVSLCVTDQNDCEACYVDVINVNSLDVNDNEIKYIKTHPNPVMDVLYISINYLCHDCEYYIVDSFGKMIAKGYLQLEKTEISVNQLLPGFYYVVINDWGDGNIKSFKMIKK